MANRQFSPSVALTTLSLWSSKSDLPPKRANDLHEIHDRHA